MSEYQDRINREAAANEWLRREQAAREESEKKQRERAREYQRQVAEDARRLEQGNNDRRRRESEEHTRRTNEQFDTMQRSYAQRARPRNKDMSDDGFYAIITLVGGLLAGFLAYNRSQSLIVWVVAFFAGAAISFWLRKVIAILLVLALVGGLISYASQKAPSASPRPTTSVPETRVLPN